MSAFALPDVQRCSPVTVTADTPVLNVFQPVAETSFTDALRNPVDCVVISDQVIFDCCHLDKPGFSCIVDQWCVASPAVWIFMLEFRSIEEFAFFVQVCENHRVCFLYENASVWSLFCQVTLSVYELYEWKVIVTSDSAVVFTKCRCDMNDTCTIAHSNVCVTCYEMSFLFLFCCCFSCTCKKWLILFVFQICSFVGFQNFVCFFTFLFCKFAEDFVQKCFCHVICVSVCCFYFAVSLIRVYAECNVGRKCPWCCCPCKEVCIFTDNFESYNCGTFFDGFISLGYFLCGKRSTTSRTVRNNLEAFVQKLLVPDFFECPPLGFDIVIIVSYIWMLHISPETNC